MPRPKDWQRSISRIQREFERWKVGWGVSGGGFVIPSSVHSRFSHLFDPQQPMSHQLTKCRRIKATCRRTRGQADKGTGWSSEVESKLDGSMQETCSRKLKATVGLSGGHCALKRLAGGDPHQQHARMVNSALDYSIRSAISCTRIKMK